MIPCTNIGLCDKGGYYEENNGDCLAVLMTLTMAVPVMAAQNAEDAIVGTLTLFAVNSGVVGNFDADTGHAFLLFTNTSGSTKQVGVYSVAAGNSVTIGTWPGGSKHWGIWYNLECYVYHVEGEFSNRVSLTMSVAQSQLATMNALIASNDEYNLITDNCVDFVLEIWYALDSYYVFSTGTPSSPNVLMNSLKTIQECEIDRSIPNNTKVGYALNGVFTQVSAGDLSEIIDKLYDDNTEIMGTGAEMQVD